MAWPLGDKINVHIYKETVCLLSDVWMHTACIATAKSHSQPVGIKWNHRCSKQLLEYTNFAICLQASCNPLFSPSPALLHDQ